MTDVSVKNSLHLLRIPIHVLGGQIFEMLRNISAWTSPNSTATYLLFTSWKSLPFSGYQSRSLSAFQALEIPRLKSLRAKKDISATEAFDLSVVLQVVYAYTQSSEMSSRKIGLVNDCRGTRFDPLAISRSIRDCGLICNMVVVLSGISQGGQADSEKANIPQRALESAVCIPHLLLSSHAEHRFSNQGQMPL